MRVGLSEAKRELGEDEGIVALLPRDDGAVVGPPRVAAFWVGAGGATEAAGTVAAMMNVTAARDSGLALVSYTVIIPSLVSRTYIRPLRQRSSLVESKPILRGLWKRSFTLMHEAR